VLFAICLGARVVGWSLAVQLMASLFFSPSPPAWSDTVVFAETTYRARESAGQLRLGVQCVFEPSRPDVPVFSTRG
jgi:hypothetical protein